MTATRAPVSMTQLVPCTATTAPEPVPNTRETPSQITSASPLVMAISARRSK